MGDEKHGDSNNVQLIIVKHNDAATDRFEGPGLACARAECAMVKRIRYYGYQRSRTQPANCIPLNTSGGEVQVIGRP